jgi:hypothetical protein
MLGSRVEVSNEHVGCKLSGLVLAQPTQGWPQIPPVVFASKSARQALQGWDHRQSLDLRSQHCEAFLGLSGFGYFAGFVQIAYTSARTCRDVS